MSDQDWEFETNSADLEKYRRDGKDLSPAINQGQKISEFRELIGVSAEEFAASCNLPAQELLALEAGLQSLTPEQAKKIAAAMGIQVSDLWVPPS